MIRHIQKDTGSEVASIEQGTSQIGQGVGLANKTGEALAPVHSMIYSTTGMIEQIAMSRKSNQRQQDKWRVTWNP